jgi:hypothetical protein
MQTVTPPNIAGRPFHAACFNKLTETMGYYDLFAKHSKWRGENRAEHMNSLNSLGKKHMYTHTHTERERERERDTCIN